MPFNSESLSIESPQEFCLALKAARERKGITLAEIASATKVPSYMFAALERGDLRRWPKGLFRRSFFRGYVGMIGVPVAETCEEFIRLFPDQEGAPATPALGRAARAAQEDVRLVFDPAWHGPRDPVLPRLLAAAVDVAAVFAAIQLARMAGFDHPALLAIVALGYFSLATIVFGESPAMWAASKRHSIVDALTQGPAAVLATWKGGVADVIADVLGSADAGTHEPVEVETAPPSRLSVRIKVSQ